MGDHIRECVTNVLFTIEKSEKKMMENDPKYVIFVLSYILTGCTFIQSIATTTPSDTDMPRISETQDVLPSPSNMVSTPYKVTETVKCTGTSVPTYTFEKAQKVIMEYLENNNNYILPCLWGICPNESEMDFSRNVLLPFSGISNLTIFTEDHATIYPILYEEKLSIEIIIYYHITDHIVDMISMILLPVVNGRINYESSLFGERTSYYSLGNVLSSYGQPDQVLIRTQGGPLVEDGMEYFDIMIMYPKKGILVNYRTKVKIMGDDILGCPNNSQVDIDLYPSGKPEIFYENIENNLKDRLPLYKPLIETTTLTINEFVETYATPTEECIKTPAILWP
jgi:hypothetical protein